MRWFAIGIVLGRSFVSGIVAGFGSVGVRWRVIVYRIGCGYRVCRIYLLGFVVGIGFCFGIWFGGVGEVVFAVAVFVGIFG